MSDWLEGLQAEVDALAERFRQSKIPAEKRIIFESILGVLAEAELLRKESLKTPTRRRQMYSKDVFTDHERAVLADKAVKRLIAETEAKRLPESRELVAAITACICETESRQLRDLNLLMQQQEPERMIHAKSAHRLHVR